MVSTPDIFSENIPISSGLYVSIKQTKARKSLGNFATTLDVKPKTAVHRLCADKSKRNTIRAVSQVWYKIPKRQCCTKINEYVKSAFYHWIIHYPQIVQSTIANDYHKITIDGKTPP